MLTLLSCFTSAANCNEDIEMRIHFQDCWTGLTVNWFRANPEKGSHVTYSTNGVCPASHPIAIPEIRYSLTFPNTNSDGLYLASDRYEGRCDGTGGYSVHADFMNGWDEDVMAEFAQLINTREDNVNVVQETSAGTLRQGRNRSPLDTDGSLSNNEVGPKCGCRNNADLSLCSIITQEDACACDQDGIVHGIDTGRPACTYESNNHGMICHVMMECESASNSGTFPGTKWRSCDPAVDGDGGADDNGGDDTTPDNGGEDDNGGDGGDGGDGGGNGGDGGEDGSPVDGDSGEGNEESGMIEFFKMNAKIIGYGCAGAFGLGFFVFLYFRWKGTFAPQINSKHRKGVSYYKDEGYAPNQKGYAHGHAQRVVGSVKGKWPPTTELV